jgi:oligoendopeptidase F
LKKYQNNPEKQLPIYESMLSTFFGCTTIQIVFSEFEYQANKIINAGQPFTIEFVKKMFLEIRKRYGAISDEAIRQINLYPYNLAQSSILRIPHFYANNFYVYKYALGQIVAIVIASEINNGNKQMINNYYKFLSIGCAKSPIDILKIININLNSNYIYLKAKKILTKLVSDFQRIKI